MTRTVSPASVQPVARLVTKRRNVTHIAATNGTAPPHPDRAVRMFFGVASLLLHPVSNPERQSDRKRIVVPIAAVTTVSV
jgi:hypothetical protein